MSEVGSVTVCVLLEDKGKILLVKNPKDEKKIPGKEPFIKPEGWGMARGRKELKDKDEVDAGRRETKEETGYEVGIDERYRVEEDIPDNRMVAFIGYPVAGKLNPDPKEIIDARWFPLRVLWVYDKNDKDYLNIHSRQRRLAQKLIQLRKQRGG